MECSKMRSEAIEQLSVSKGAPTCRGFFTYSKKPGQYFKTAPILKMKKYISMKHLQTDYTLQKLHVYFFLPLSIFQEP